MSLKYVSIFSWNISPAGTVPNGSLIYWYLQNVQDSALKNNDLSLTLKLLYLNLASISMMYLSPTSLKCMLYSVGSLWIGQINVLSNHARPKHNLTFPLALGTRHLLHHSDISSTSEGIIICCFCSNSISSFSGFCTTKGTLLGGAWNGGLPSFTCKENVLHGWWFWFLLSMLHNTLTVFFKTFNLFELTVNMF